MKTTNKKKQFDCLAVKEKIQAQIFKETKNMSRNELLNYFNNKKTNSVNA